MLVQAGLLLLGLLARLYWPGLLWPVTGLLLGVLGLAAVCDRRLRLLGFLLLGGALGQSAIQSHYQAIQRLEERYLVVAEVTGIPRVTAASTQFDALLGFPRDARRLPQRARLSWPGPAGRSVRAGDHWQLAVRLRPPREPYNPGAVDLERNYLRDHIQAVGAVIASPLNRRQGRAPWSLVALRERMASHISAAVSDPASGALLAALAVGATGEVTREQWRIFNATGITHLVAISGMHVTLFAVVAMAAARRLWAVAARLGLRARRDRFAATAGIALATGYALLAGFSVPTQRTLIMLSAWLLLRECGRASRPSASLAIAILVVVALDPFAVLSAGFWLSFIAVAAIIGIAGGRLLPQGSLQAAITVQAAVFVALLPVTLAIFGSVSLAGLLVNVAAIPVFTFALVPAALGATALLLCLPAVWSAPLSALVLRVAAWGADLLAPWLARAADHSHALWLASPPAWWFALSAPAVLCLLLPWSPRLRWLGVCALLPLLGTGRRAGEGELVATVLDVGQATAVLVETAHHALLYGTGDGFRSGGGAVERIVLPVSRAGGLQKLDALLLPRLDRDAGDGYTALLGGMPVSRVLAAAAAGPDSLPPEVASCAGAPPWDWDGWQFDLLRDPANGCVLKVSGAGGGLLLGDTLDTGGEAQLLAQGLSGVDVWLVPRHGAASANASAWLGALEATQAIASVRRSVLGTDAYQQTVARYARHGIRLRETGREGAIVARLASGHRPTLRASRSGRLGVWSLDPAGLR